MSQFLSSDVLLSSSPSGPYLTRSSGGPRHPLTVGEAVAVNLLAAVGNETEAKQLASNVLGDSAGTWVSRILQRFPTFFGDGVPRFLNCEWLATLRPEFCKPPPRRQAAPAAITWLVTLACNRKCPYCFYDVHFHRAHSSESPKDASFGFPHAIRMLEEMAFIGTGDLYLTGGEPLLRQDIVDIIAVAHSHHLRTHVVTKYPINARLADRLAAAGLTDITVSLDDARPHVASALAGASNYLDEAVEAIQSLVRAEIAVKVNSVVSSVNQDELDQLARLMIELRVPDLAISPYVTPQTSRSNTLQLSPPAGLFLERCGELQSKYAGQLEVHVGGSQLPDDSSGARACGRHVDCDVGIDALDVLPDGRVTRCRYLPNEPALVVGDLKQQSLMDIWDGDTLRQFQGPARDAYSETACHTCDGFDGCNTRGRCYFTALSNHGTLYAPDVFCKQ